MKSLGKPGRRGTGDDPEPGDLPAEITAKPTEDREVIMAVPCLVLVGYD